MIDATTDTAADTAVSADEESRPYAGPPALPDTPQEPSWFDLEQHIRAEALHVARDVLAARSSTPLSSSRRAADALDLVNVASWIVSGEDPWTPARDLVVEGRWENSRADDPAGTDG